MNQPIDTVGFAKAIEKEIASIEAERQRAREAKALEEKKYDEACRTALRVRDEVILPLLHGLCDAFIKAKISPRWEVESEGKMDNFAGSCRSCSVNPGDLCFRIKAEVAVQDKGAKFRFTVVCEGSGQGEPPAKKSAELHKVEHDIANAAEADVTSTRRWYCLELEKCAVACVREKWKLVV